jgi:transposase
LFLAHSAYSQKKTKPFVDTFSHINELLLHRPGLLENLEDLDVEDLAVQLHELSRHRLTDPLQSAKQFQEALHESFSVPKELEPTIQFALDRLIAVIRNLEDQIKSVEGEITALVKNDYPEVAWLRSIPGIGLIFASGIAAEIGNLQRFFERLRWDKKRKCYHRRSARHVEDAVAKFAGLWWPENASGDFVAEEKPLSKRGNAYLRYYILQAADRMRLFIPSYSAYYSKKFIQATKHHHKRAVVLTGRKAVGLIVGLLHHHEFYRPEEASPRT